MALDIKKLRKIVNENQEALILLEDYDATGKLGKIRKKRRYNFTIDQKIMNEFKDYCKKNELVMSNEIEKLIKKRISRK